MMKSPLMALVIMISLFIGQGNPSAFDPNLSSFIDNAYTLHTPCGDVNKDALEVHQEISPSRISSANSATNENKVFFRLSPTVRRSRKRQSTASAEKSKGVFNFLMEGVVTPSGPSPKVNSMATEQRLPTSSNSPGLGHMQMIRPKSITVNGDSLKSHHSLRDDRVRRKKKNKRKLGSTPSPGDGH